MINSYNPLIFWAWKGISLTKDVKIIKHPYSVGILKIAQLITRQLKYKIQIYIITQRKFKV